MTILILYFEDTEDCIDMMLQFLLTAGSYKDTKERL
jgi:hypothetical protein